ncbi:MAG: GHKL domain-containing protein, partial [Rhizobiales bacterium]|nr:GHKL domain-containing protein [Hyphomicrobiales bacterium]
EIRIVVHDEVSNISLDLNYFQKTAIEVVKTNQRLAAEVEERILTEKQLQSTQNELIQAGKLAALGQLSVGITHEINQPLTAIASHIHTANLRLKNNQLDGVRHSLDKIKFLLNKVAVITRHLKSFARKTDAELLNVEVNRVIEEALELMSGRLKILNCDLKYTSSDHNLMALAEPVRLEQVLVNLLSNAIDAVKGREIQQIELKVYQENLEVFIEVHDTGLGIPKAQLDYIFDPFYSDKEIGEGLGLGLSISYNIVQDFNGQIRVKSELDKGSIFTLVLKLAKIKKAHLA